jgi:hypothetical protein
VIKKRVLAISVLLIALAIVFSAEAGSDKKDSSDETFTIQGIGYPPIKAQNVAQAHLMAKRAAIIDAYRNALAAAGIQNYNDDTLYAGLSGFVSGLTILEEEYLEDGGIRILAQVPVENIAVSANIIHSAPKKSKETWLGPLRVTLAEWYRIIKKLVRIEQ